MLQVLDTGSNSAEANMRLDEKLLLELRSAMRSPFCISINGTGPLRRTDISSIRANISISINRASIGLSLARRPTGGGIVFHIWDLAFSFLMPSAHPRFSLNTLDNYRFVNESVLEVMKDFLELPGPGRS